MVQTIWNEFIAKPFNRNKEHRFSVEDLRTVLNSCSVFVLKDEDRIVSIWTDRISADLAKTEGLKIKEIKLNKK